jgi:hypothetical protein
MDEKAKEFVAPKRWTGKQILLFAVTVAVLIAAIVFTLSKFAPVAIIFIFGILGVYYMFNSFKAEYAYTISNRFLVEVLKKNGDRVSVADLFMSDMTLCAPCSNPQYKESAESADKLIDVSTDKSDSKTYFALFERDEKKTVVLFTPSEMMLNEIDKHTSHKSIR